MLFQTHLFSVWPQKETFGRMIAAITISLYRKKCNGEWWLRLSTFHQTSPVVFHRIFSLNALLFSIYALAKKINQCYISDVPRRKKRVGGCRCRMKVWASEKRDGRMNVLSCSSDANFSHDWQTRRIHGSVCLPQPVRKAILTNRVTAEASNQRQTAHSWSMDTSLT